VDVYARHNRVTKYGTLVHVSKYKGQLFGILPIINKFACP